MMTASNNELFVKLIKELGVNLFNQWYTETFGKPAPHIPVKGKGRGAKMKKDFVID